MFAWPEAVHIRGCQSSLIHRFYFGEG